jgi:hypothetical protein
LREALTISREDQIRLSSQVTRLSEVMDYLLEENASCFIENSNLYGWAQQSYRFNQRVAKQLGINLADELSPLPDRKERPKRPEFEARTAQQAAVLVQTSTVTGVVPANDTAAKPS